MNSLMDYSITDLLPDSLTKDAFLVALAEAVEIELKELYREAEMISNFYDVNRLPEILLNFVAHQKHVDFYDNALPIETKRRLVKESPYLHRIKGTPRAIEKAASTIFGRSKIDEWFDYNGDPFCFRISVESDKHGASEAELISLDKLINAYKNVRSHLDKISIYLASQGGMNFAGCALAGEHTIIYPWSTTKLEGKGNMRFGAGYQSMETTIIYPA
ncbi:phage tail protein I [Desulfitobacterium chlororespirans]|uniref:Phage tail protein, P2 protein I family n=1 Tax=Desulfitobacterium chlororespirans DSM 11544 TaxID=1121395 RepID=A0A1M7U2A5_9FIRM|nr:phage tail protein I [Desulfitobacterium chlororespirans]SHN77171.1 phage tail protein, P2 protein I family [Desulfitobacterium chlororespirans DSM 11544]